MLSSLCKALDNSTLSTFLCSPVPDLKDEEQLENIESILTGHERPSLSCETAGLKTEAVPQVIPTSRAVWKRLYITSFCVLHTPG